MHHRKKSRRSPSICLIQLPQAWASGCLKRTSARSLACALLVNDGTMQPLELYRASGLARLPVALSRRPRLTPGFCQWSEQREGRAS